MEKNSTNELSRIDDEASKGGELTALVRNLAVPSLEKVLKNALMNGSLHAAQSTGALSSDQELQAILGGFSPYSVSQPSEAAREVARDFTTVYTAGLPEERLAAVRRLTAGFWAARTALEAVTQKAPPEEMQTLRGVVTRLHAGYVLLIATVHTLLDGAPTTLFSAFKELLDADTCLKDLSGWFVDIRAAESPSARRVAVRLMFNKFCSEATKPTIYGDAISALVQSMLDAHSRAPTGSAERS